MSGLFGGGGNNSIKQEIYAGIQVSTSQYGQAVPYLRGRRRVPLMLAWYGSFKGTESDASGGKGGGGSGQKTWNYTTAFIGLLTRGPIDGIARIWHDKAMIDLGSESANLAEENMALSLGGAAFTGSITGTALTVSGVVGLIQIGAVLSGANVIPGTTITAGSGTTWTVSPTQSAPSSFMSSSQLVWSGYPAGTPAGEQIVYDGFSYVASSLYDLGSSASMPNLTVEAVSGGFSDAHGMFDADLSAVLIEYLTDPLKGAGFQGRIQTLQGPTDTWQAYLMSLGLLGSPYEDTQRAATDLLKELMDSTNSQCFCSVGTLNVKPLAVKAVSATTADGSNWSYTPNLTPVFDFNDDHYCPNPGEPPVKLIPKFLHETHNAVNVEYVDRANEYVPHPVNCSVNDGLGGIALTGIRLMSTLTWHHYTNPQAAHLAGMLYLLADLYENNRYQFRTRQDFSKAEPLDYVNVSDSKLGLVSQLCRIEEMEDDREGEDYLTFTVVEIAGIARSAPQYNWNSAAGYTANYATAPGSVLAPQIFIMPPAPAALVGGITLGIAVGPGASSTNWLGCNVWVSLDGTNYLLDGMIPGPALYGTIGNSPAAGTADPDVTNTVRAVLNNNTLQILTSVTHADADNARSLILVGSGSTAEVLAYGAASLVSAGTYDLSYLHRGLYGSVNQAHTSGVPFVRLDSKIYQKAFEPGMAGQTVYFKFTSFNTWQKAEEDLSGVTAYSYTIPAALTVDGSARWVPQGTTVGISADGETVYKSNGTAAWDSAAYGKQAYLNGSYVSFRAGAGHSMVGFSTTPASTADYHSINFGIEVDIATGNMWRWISATSDNAQMSSGTITPANVFEMRYDGITMRWFLDGVLFYAIRAPGLILYPKVCLYAASTVVGSLTLGPATANNIVGGNYLSTMPWVIGSAQVNQGNYQAINAGAAGSGIVLAGAGGNPKGPYGSTEALWYTIGNAVNNADGGWNNTGDIQGIDPSKTYRSCVWMYYTYSGSLSGRFFFGCDDNGATKDLNGTLDLNPYFVSGLLGSLTVNRWYLLVGFIHGSGYGTSPAGLGGVYDPVTGAQVLSATEFKMAAGVTFQKQRAYQYYTTTAGVQVYFARPRFEEVNGSEPSLALLLSPNGELAYLDQVDTPNVVNNAISQIGSNTNAAASTASCGPSGSADQDAVSFTIITTGAPVGIDISTTVTITNSGNNGGAAAWITVQRDGTDIGTAKWDGAGAYHAASYTAFSEGVSLNVIDAPALGSHVYTLHLHVQGSGTSGTFAMTATNSSIKVREYKK